MSAVVVDKDYGSISPVKLKELQRDYQSQGICCRLEHYDSEADIIEHCQDASAILATGNPPISAYVLKNLPNLKIVQRFGIGVNSVDLDAASQHGVIVLNMPNFCIEELATHAASMILGLSRNTCYYDRHIRNGEWPKAQYYEPRNLGSLTLGLYGFGGSARPLFRIMHMGFGTRVIACDPYITQQTKDQYPDVNFFNFETLLEKSDIISIHAPLTETTIRIFNQDAFSRMKNDSMIINISRGSLIDEKALIKALDSGKIRFAGLDVFEKEPIDSMNPLTKMENVVLTCHSAFYGDTAQATQLHLALDLVTRALNENIVDPYYVANKAVMNNPKNKIGISK